MGDPRGFIKHGRRGMTLQPVYERLQHHEEHYDYPVDEKVKTQASRCMECGVPFCMSGGFAYVLDDDNRFRRRCNQAMVDLEQMSAEDEDAAWLKQIIIDHYELTGSPHAAEILADWDRQLVRFVRVFPHEYRRVLAEQALKLEQGKEAVHG